MITGASSCTMVLTDLPLEVLTQVFSHLANPNDFPGLLALRRVSKATYLAASQERIWHQVATLLCTQYTITTSHAAGSFPALCRLALDNDARVAQLPHLNAFVHVSWLHSLTPKGPFCSRCWERTTNQVMTALEVRLCNGCLSHSVVSHQQAFMLCGVDDEDLLELADTEQLRAVHHDETDSALYLRQELVAIGQAHYPAVEDLQAAQQLRQAEAVAQQHAEQALRIARELAMDASLRKYQLDITALQARFATVDLAKPPRWALVYQRCLDFAATTAVQPEMMLSLQAELLAVELASACHSSHKAKVLQERLPEYSLPEYWVTSQDTIDVTTASMYPELVFFIMGDWISPPSVQSRVDALLTIIAQEEQKRQVVVEAIRSQLIAACQGNATVLQQARRSPAYQRLMGMRRPPSVSEAVDQVLKPLIAQLENKHAGHQVRRNLISMTLSNQHASLPTAEELTFFAAWGRPELHPLSQYQRFVEGETGSSLDAAVNQWLSYAPSDARQRLLGFIRLVGVSWLVSMLHYDFGDVAKLHLLRYIATTKTGHCPYNHSAPSQDDTPDLDMHDDDCLCDPAALSMDVHEDLVSPPLPGRQSPSETRPQSSSLTTPPLLARASRLRNRSNSSPEYRVRPTTINTTDTLATRAPATESNVLLRHTSHGSFASSSPHSASATSTSNCHCEAPAVHRLAIAFIRWAARLNRLQSHLPQRNLLSMMSASGRAVLVQLTQQVFGSLPAATVRDYSDVMSLKLRGFFNLNLELPPMATTLSGVPPEWHASSQGTRRVAEQLVHLEAQYRSRCQAVEAVLAQHHVALACEWQQAHAMVAAGIASGGLMATLAQYVHGQSNQSWKAVEQLVRQASQRHGGKRSRAASVTKVMSELLPTECSADLDPVAQLPTEIQVQVDEYMTYGPEPKHACLMATVVQARTDLNRRTKIAQRSTALKTALQSVRAWTEGSLAYRKFVIEMPAVAKALADIECPLTTVAAQAQAVVEQYPSREDIVQFYLTVC